MTRRNLRPDEIELWRKVTDQTERLHPEPKLDPVEYLAKPKPAPKREPFTLPDRFVMGQNAVPPRNDLKSSVADQLSAAPVQMDKKSFSRMKRGKLKPEGRIDLHGMTLDRAHGVLIPFILQAHQSGKRLVLVITGKGKRSDDTGPIPRPRGILRHHVPGWLAQPPLAQAVLQITPAHISHGGEGAYYVYLRRRR